MKKYLYTLSLLVILITINVHGQSAKAKYRWNIFGSGHRLPVKKEKKIYSLTFLNYTDSIFPNSTILKFHHLKELQIIVAKENQYLIIDTLNLKKLNKLKELEIAFCRFSEFPLIFSTIDSLKSLRLGFCNLKQIPNNIMAFKNIEELEFRGNYLTDLPDSICKLKKLRTLDLDNNCFVELPKVLLQIEKLKKIYVANAESGNYGNRFVRSIWIPTNRIYIDDNDLQTISGIIESKTISSGEISFENCLMANCALNLMKSKRIKKRLLFQYCYGNSDDINPYNFGQ